MLSGNIQSALSRTLSFLWDFRVKVDVKFTEKWGKTGNKKRQSEQLKESFYKKKKVWYGPSSPCIWDPTLRLSKEQVGTSPETPVLHMNLPQKTLNL